MPRHRLVPRRVAVSVTLLALALSGCSGEDTRAVARPAPSSTYVAGDVPVLLPGAPGEPAQVLPSGAVGTRQNPLAYDDAEVEFVTGMVPHHAQALEMARLAPGRASDKRVLALASRIEADQGPEISTMQAWLKQNGLPPAGKDGDHHGMPGMPGMASEADVGRLVAAEGPAFDRLFLQLMTKHHQGALAMVERAGSVANLLVADMVSDTQVKQSVEIQRMQALRALLPT